jgi:uncharacterized repeat protein (TIGR04138 family)
MPDPAHAIRELLAADKRYKFAAYSFVFEALSYAHTVLGMGAETPSVKMGSEADEEEDEPQRHLTGQQLCEAIRLYALDQYGYMAKCVLNSWGIQTTGDFGEIVFNLIRIGHMRKTESDRREDFDDVYDFESALTQSFQITPPE